MSRVRRPKRGSKGVGAVRTLAISLIFYEALSCGYGPVYRGYGVGSPARLHVTLLRTLVADAVASDEVASGAREELARRGALEDGDGYPRVEIEVLRADESSEGIASGIGGPVARATNVAVAARAWIVRAAGAPPERDTGDLRAQDVIAVDEKLGELDPRSSGFHHADALRAAARRLGRKLAHRVLGEPAASEDMP